MKIDKCGRPKTQKIKPRYICFIWLISLFSFYKLRNLDRDLLQYFDFIQRSLVKTWKGDHINIAWILVLKTENDVEFLQSAKKKKIGNTPILSIFEILSQTAFIEKDQDDDQNQVLFVSILQ